MEVVINCCFGGFSLSREAFLELRAMGNKHALAEPDYGEMWDDGSGPRKPFGIGTGDFLRDIPRDDRDLIAVVKKLRKKAAGECAELRVLEIPDGVDWDVEEYDGLEHIAESHRTWG